jgi:hypothetical protein
VDASSKAATNAALQKSVTRPEKDDTIKSMSTRFFSKIWMLAAGACLAGGHVRADEPDFTREVRPILARYCFKCHGPDERYRKARLRLDEEKSAHKSVIVPGRPQESELIERVFSADADHVMPPPSTKTALSKEQKELLKRWIAAGGKYQKHWAFVPPRQVPLPVTKDRSWPANGIDHFILAGLEAQGLKPSPAAERHTLIRRLSLDLIGLPPTPDEVDVFLKDTTSKAYESLVDRLLASPHYGERWARRWLDVARYADTNGYEKDRPRIIWPYRDWVIKAINADMPFDQFTIEQIAGDLLPDATPEQIVATGFHRNTMVNEEGGIDPLEFRYYAVVDRVNTTGTTWLGLTIGCAQCHSHKYDPVTQGEYFQMLAFLNNADEPDYFIPDRGIAKRRAEMENRIAGLMKELSGKFPGGSKSLEEAFTAWQQRESRTAVAWQALRPTAMKTSMPHLALLPDGSILASGDQTKSDTYDLKFTDKIKGVTALRLEVLPHESLPGGGPGRTYYEGTKGDFFLSELSLKVAGKPVKFAAASDNLDKSAKAGARFAVDGDPATAWSTSNRPGQRHEAVLNFAQPVDFDGSASIRMLFERYYACGLGRFRISVTTAGTRAEAGDHGAEVEAVLAKPESRRSAEERELLFKRFLETAPQLGKFRKEIDSLKASLPSYQITMVMKERPPQNPRATHRHHRGEYLQPKEKVEPGSLAILQSFPKDEPPNRLGFARWLVSSDNPLTARVTVNRQWQAFFGLGLVKTTEDFGIQGNLPTHPELLDWLAIEFMKRGWSMKKLHKLIVMSATYRQASNVGAELLAKDPENRLLARGPRVRLEAELIRDSLLRASGLLSGKLGGPSVFPPQPVSVTTEGVYGSIKWDVSKGEDRYRRGLYTFLKRSIPYAMFATFDGATGDACLARREVSNTPLQALTMMNDLVIIESAQALGRKLAASAGSVEDRMQELFRRCLTRPPSTQEAAALLDFYRRQSERLQSGKVDAKAIAGGADGDVAQRAAWTLAARAVFNLDEMITKE